MKTTPTFDQRRNWISFLIMLFAFGPTFLFAQTTPTVYGLVILQKVEPAKQVEFEKVMKENWLPLHQLRKQNGKITNWALYRVPRAGASDEYNYVTIMFYDAFAKTEPNDKWPELMKAANPKADAAAIIAKTQNLRTIMRRSLYTYIDGTVPKTGAPLTKYISIGFMKSKSIDYVKMEQEIWKPYHQASVDAGKRNGWGLWHLTNPGGTSSNHDYVVVDVFSSYEQVAEADGESIFKKVHAGKDVMEISDRTLKSRDMVRSELWELVLSLN